jgi:hypothetical protein
MMEGDIREYISYIFTFIGGDLEPVIDIFHLYDNHRVVGPEQVGYSIGKHIIGNIFKSVNLDTAIPDE